VLRSTGILVAVALVALGSRPAAAGTAPRRTVLILHSTPRDLPGVRELDTAVTDGLRAASKVGVDLYVEYTGLDRFTGPTYERDLLALYNEKYATRKVDLVIVVGPSALDWLIKQRFLADVPVITCYVARRLVEAARLERPELTGGVPPQNAPATLELMLRMFPATRRIHVVLGSSDYEREQAVQGQRIFKSFEDRVQLDYLNDLTLPAIESRLAALPDEDLVLFGSMMRDASGQDFDTNQALTRISAASRRPVFGVVAEDLGDGILGGVLLSMELSGKVAAEVGARVLAGERASAIPLTRDAGAAPMFDWRQLQRFAVRERELPAGHVIKFRQPSVWELHKREISAGVGVIIVETLLVAGLIIQLRRRRRFERALEEAGTRYRTVADFTHDWEFWQRADGAFEYVSPACEQVSGHPREDFERRPEILAELTVAEDQPAFLEHQAAALAGQPRPPLAYRIRRSDGEVRWVEQTNNPVCLDGGRLAGTRGSIRDVTDRMKAELDLKKAYREIGALKDQLEAENTYYREKIQSVEGSSELVGRSDPMKYLHFRIGQVAPSATTVLIQGETGTGKELVAEAIHKLGPRRDRPLVKINCAALPPSLAESELFGHEKGAFTGAQALRKGRFELADQATLFLDEVGELSQEVQAKLLRVLQDGSFQRVGGDRTIRVDVRVIAATNRDLSKEVAAARFREDLWYRLNVFPITVPALRHRREDIPMLAQTFAARFCQRLGRPSLELPRAVVQKLQAHNWPGNVRELQNMMEQAVLVSEGNTLRLPDSLRAPEVGADVVSGKAAGSLAEAERDHIIAVLVSTGWKLEGPAGAAEILGLRPSTLRSRMAKLGIQRDSHEATKYRGPRNIVGHE
jgi:PAS domain S-box-containing protein